MKNLHCPDCPCPWRVLGSQLCPPVPPPSQLARNSNNSRTQACDCDFHPAASVGVGKNNERILDSLLPSFH